MKTYYIDNIRVGLLSPHDRSYKAVKEALRVLTKYHVICYREND